MKLVNTLVVLHLMFLWENKQLPFNLKLKTETQRKEKTESVVCLFFVLDSLSHISFHSTIISPLTIIWSSFHQFLNWNQIIIIIIILFLLTFTVTTKLTKGLYSGMI